MLFKNLFFSTCCFIPLFAQTLTVDDAISKALTSHPNIKIANLALQQSKSIVDISRSAYLPQVSLYGEYTPSKTYALPVKGQFQTKDESALIASATITQKVYDFGKTLSSIKSSQEQTKIAKYNLQDAKALLTYQIKVNYNALLLNKEALKVEKKDLQSKQELYNQTKELVKLGLKTEADASRFLSELYVAKDRVAIAKANYDKTLSTLALTIHEPLDENVTLAPLPATYILPNENDILTSAPQLQSIQSDIHKDELAYKSTKASHFGSLDASASYSYQNSLNEYDATYVGIALKIPLYSGGRTSALVEQALLQKQTKESLYQAKKLLLQENIKATLIDLKRFKISIEARKAQLKAAEQTYNLLEGRYKEGLSTYIELLDASALQLSAKLALLNTQAQKKNALFKLEYYQGKTK